MLLSNPKQVQRKDGRPVPPFPDQGFWRETWLTIMELKDPRIIACRFEARIAIDKRTLIPKRLLPLVAVPLYSLLAIDLSSSTYVLSPARFSWCRS
jgi:hypothetical protein